MLGYARPELRQGVRRATDMVSKQGTSCQALRSLAQTTEVVVKKTRAQNMPRTRQEKYYHVLRKTCVRPWHAENTARPGAHPAR